jgi:hypothetical protein
MGQHSAKQAKTDIVHKAAPIVRSRTHVFFTFCKHTILELPAGLIAILIFESHREGWLNLVGTQHNSTEHAIRTITTIFM